MMINTTLFKPDQRLAFYKGRAVVFEKNEDMDEKLAEAKKLIDAEVEEEVKEIVRKFINGWRFD